MNGFVYTYPSEEQVNFGTKYQGCIHMEITGTDENAYSWNGSEVVFDSEYIEPLTDNPNGDELILAPLLDVKFRKLNYNSIDFKRHLLPTVALNKKVLKRTDGAPHKSEYYVKGVHLNTDKNSTYLDDEDVLVAEIEFGYILGEDDKLQRRRTEYLRYRRADKWTGDIIIKDKVFDLSDLNDFAIVIEEREQGRKSLISEIKSMLLGVLSATNPTLSTKEVIALGLPFFVFYKDAINAFTEMGDDTFRDALTATDLGTTPYSWLGVPIAPSVTLRDYMVAKLTYEAETDHPDE